MKKHLVLFFFILSIFILNAQNNVKLIDVRNDKIPILVDGEWQIMDHYKVLNLLEDNIYSFFGLHDKYPSALKKQMFEKTPEYTDVLVPKFQKIKEDLKNITIEGFAYEDKFVRHGKVEELEKINGLDAENIACDIHKYMHI